MTEAAAEPGRRGPASVLWRVLAFAGLAVAVGLIVLVAALYLARRQIAREAVTGWLRSRGIASRSEFQELGPGRLVGRVEIGPAGAPDLSVDRVEVHYSLAGLIAGKGVQVTDIRLTRPVLRARWRGGRFSAGALDPLIAEFQKRPPTPGAPSPAVQIDQGRLLLATDYGSVRATADARIADGRLVRLAATTDPLRLAGEGMSADLAQGSLSAEVTGSGLQAQIRAPFTRLARGAAEARDGVLTASFQGGYPDPAAATPLVGRGSAELEAAALRTAVATAAQVHVTATSAHLTWTRAGGDRFAGDLRLGGETHGLTASELRLATAAGDFHGGFALGHVVQVKLAGSVDARGAWTGLGAPASGDSPEIAAVKRAARGFRASAQGLVVTADATGAHSGLRGPARLVPDTGGAVTLTPASLGWRLALAGGGLPKTDAQVRGVSFAGRRLTATGAITTALSIGPLQQADIAASGALRIAGGKAAFTADRCAEVKAARFDLGQNAVEHPAGRFCPSGGPLLSIGKGGWALKGRLQDGAGAVPFLQADVSKAQAVLALAQRGPTLSGDIALSGAAVRDTAPTERFRPLEVAGRLGLARDIWSGGFDARLPKGALVAHAALRQEAASGAGQVEITTPRLAFARGGLQPQDLSPAAQPLGNQVEGEAEFAGRFAWTKAKTESSGRLEIPGLAFKSPVGQVQGLTGEVRFSSLAPLVAAPGQTLRVEKVASALPLTGASLSFGLSETALTGSGVAQAGGGRLRLESLDVPLAKDGAVKGVLVFEGVQLHDLVEASPFGDRVDLDAKVSGRVPFEVAGGKVRVSGGDLHAVAPGRLSISRAALTGVQAQGSVEAPAPAAAQAGSSDTFTDFAYQALENLAFVTLDAGIGTRSDGRLGVLFHIVGRHDPPKPQEITLSWMDVLRRRLPQKMPLPSGTGVDLTLDTTLNLDELLKDYADFQQLRSSPPVQP